MGFFTGPHRRTLHSLKLRDGRKLRYLVEGPRDIEHTPVPTLRDSQLPVIVALHATFLSAQSVLLDAPAAQKKPTDYVVVAVNRPGYHGSSNVEVGTYSYTDFALDIEELVNYLQVKKFAVIGHSSGGPCTLACAALLGPDRVTAYATLGGDPEYAHYTDIEASVVLDCVGKCLPTFLTLIGPFVCITNVANGLRNDFYVEREPYPFKMDEITQPGLVVLGEKDTLVPFAIAKRNHDRLPQATLQIMPGLGHNQLLHDDVLAMVFRAVIDLGHLRNNTEVANGETTTTTAAAAGAAAVKTLQHPTPDKVVLAKHILQSNVKNQNKYDIRKTMVNTSTASFVSEECEC